MDDNIQKYPLEKFNKYIPFLICGLFIIAMTFLMWKFASYGQNGRSGERSSGHGSGQGGNGESDETNGRSDALSGNEASDDGGSDSFSGRVKSLGTPGTDQHGSKKIKNKIPEMPIEKSWKPELNQEQIWSITKTYVRRVSKNEGRDLKFPELGVEGTQISKLSDNEFRVEGFFITGSEDKEKVKYNFTIKCKPEINGFSEFKIKKE